VWAGCAALCRRLEPDTPEEALMKHQARAIGLAALVLSVGCATPGRMGTSPFERLSTSWRAQNDDLVIVVQNEHWRPMRVWVDWPGYHEFLGDVAAGSTARFRLPAPMARRYASLRLYADPDGSTDEVRSDAIDVTRGHRIEWRLRKALANSRATIM
jgi:hypothetical protein